jgi:signal transduction histidine kinase
MPRRARWTYPSADVAAQRHAAWHSGSETTLRTQLAVVKGFGQLLDRSLQHADAPQRATALSGQLVAHVAELEQLLLSYLAASRLQWDGADLDRHPVNLSALTRQVARGFDDGPGAAPALNLEPFDPVQGVWDARWLQEALRALISNALRYSPPDGSVRIVLHREDARVRVAISDSGPGVAPDEHEQIFLPFVRGSAARAVPGGWGLGLFIAGRVAEIHGGTVEVESGPGAGSVFTLCLPLVLPSAPPEASRMH